MYVATYVCVNILIFADETKCYKHISNNINANLLQLDLESLSKWSTDNDLIFNSLC